MSKKEENISRFLGLGTMVEVDDMDALRETKYVVIARAVGKSTTGQTVLRYRIVPHPLGVIEATEEQILTVEASQVVKVDNEGYSDEKDDNYLDELLGQMTGSLKEMVASVNKNPEVQEEILEEVFNAQKEKEDQTIKEKAMLVRDPFYKFKKRGTK
ncbi:DUF4176 domain-containing protein [Lactovum odontotermitis]